MPGNIGLEEWKGTVDLDNAVQLSESLAEEISRIKEDCLSKFPVERYIGSIKKYPEASSYGYVSTEVAHFCRELTEHANSNTLDLYHRLVLVNLILRSDESRLLQMLPQDIRSLYYADFARILKEISSNCPEVYSYTRDRFRKDIAICSLRMIPAGAQKIHVNRLPRRFLFYNLRQFMQGLLVIITELGGFVPLFEMHTDFSDPDLMAEFNEEGRIRFYKRVSEILKIYPRVRGVFGGSWYYDPALENISPHLAYLRRIPLTNGGKFFHIGSNKQAIKDATLKSRTRRRLYNEGKYLPTSYLLIWSREKLMRWAEKSR